MDRSLIDSEEMLSGLSQFSRSLCGQVVVNTVAS